MGNISILSLADNGLSKLKPISRLLGLVTLNLSNNKIEDFDEVEYLDRLPMLQEVDMSFNPICSEADYRSQVLGRFPNRIHDLMVSFKITSKLEFRTFLHKYMYVIRSILQIFKIRYCRLPEF